MVKGLFIFIAGVLIGVIVGVNLETAAEEARNKEDGWS